jgi:hypothetical protein
MLVEPIPWARRHWALPFFWALVPSPRSYANRCRQPVRLADRARRLLHLVRRWLPRRRIVVVAHNSFAALRLLVEVRRNVTMLTRLRLDAALYDPVPARVPGTRGRPRMSERNDLAVQDRFEPLRQRFYLPALAIQGRNPAWRELRCWQIAQQPDRCVAILVRQRQGFRVEPGVDRRHQIIQRGEAGGAGDRRGDGGT